MPKDKDKKKHKKKGKDVKKSADNREEYEEKDTQVLSQYEHIRTKDKDTGPKEPKTIPLPFWDEDEGGFRQTDANVSVAMMTMIDEVIVNIGDHNTNYPNLVTDVDIAVDLETGEVTIRNNGPGIPVYEVWIKKDEKTGKLTPIKMETMDPPMTAAQREEHKKEIYWNPEVIATYPLAGTNLKKRSDHRTGGTNGIGLKCTVYQSRKFRLVTVDEHRKTKYEQTYEGRSDHLEIHKPKLTFYGTGDEKAWDSNKHQSFTRMSFTPEYTLFGGEEYDKNNHGYLVMEYLRMRAYQLKVYTGMKVTFMGKLVPINNLAEYAMLHTSAPRNEHEKELVRVAHCVMDYRGSTSDAAKYQWEVAIIPNLRADSHHVTLVNSIYPYEGGTHVEYLLDLLVPALAELLRKDMNKSVDDMKDLNRGGSLTKLLKSQLCIFARCPINAPAFSGQIKAFIMTSKKDYLDRTFPTSMIRSIWKVVETYVKYQWLSKNALSQSHIRNVSGKKLDYDGYTPAANAGKKNRKEPVSLFIPEGVSAAQLIDNGLSSREVPDIDFENHGYFNIQGVPMNARRAYQLVINPETGEEFKIGTDKLLDNERFGALIRILGLDFHKKYATEEEISELPYNYAILAVDQDEDGKGNIATLILNIFSVFWPELIKHGFVKIMRTPIVTVRVRKGKNAHVKEFYTTDAHDAWLKEEYPNGLPSGSVVKYHKGLACNSKKEGIRIFKKFATNIVTFKWDHKAEKNFEIFYGSDSSKRKKVLSTPTDWSIIDQDAFRKKCSLVLNTDTKSYQQYNVNRKIPGFDGLLDGRRKILSCARIYFATKSRIANVNSFGGAVKDMHDYQHGESSLNGSIVKMGQEFTGAMVIPPLKGSSISGFGSRKKGGKDAGSARYISTKLNHGPMNALFPPEDDYLLKPSASGEPEYFIPIQPFGIIQGDMHIPAHGWKVKSFAVDPMTCINLTKDCITGAVEVKDPDDIPMLPVCTVGWKGKIVCYHGVIYSVGKYKWNPDTNTITITELPHGVFSSAYAFGDRKKEKRKKEKWRVKQQQLSAQQKQEDAERVTLEKQQLKEFRRSIKSKKHGEEYDDARNDTDSDGDESGDESGEESTHNKKTHKGRRGDDEYRSRTIKDKPFVDNVLDKSEDDNIRIEITLTEGGYERILEEYELAQNEEHDDTDEDVGGIDSDGEERERTVRFGGRTVRVPPKVTTIDCFDPIEEYFLLRRSLTPQLNFLDRNKVVKHFNSYEEIFADWYPVRKALYEQRVERQIILLKYEIIELENTIRYSKEYEELKMGKKSSDVVDGILEEHKFMRLNTKLLHNPKYTKVDELEEGIIDESIASFDYLTHLRFTETHEAAILKNEKTLIKLKDDYEEKCNDTKDKNGMFTGAKTWTNELNELEDILKQGFKHGWGYDEPRDIYSDDDGEGTTAAASSDDDSDAPKKSKKSKKSKTKPKKPKAQSKKDKKDKKPKAKPKKAKKKSKK